MRAIRHILCLAGLLLATGCSTYSLQELRSTTPKGTPFQAALAVRYLRAAEDDAKNYNWINSGYFADKGLASAYGKDVPPERLDHWEVPEEDVPALRDARTQLEAALTPERISQQPDMAAEAQYNFDCWVENAERGTHADDLADCRDEFWRALKQLQAAPKARRVSSGKSVEKEPNTEAYLVFFAFDSDALDERAERMVDDVAAQLNRKGAHYTVTLNGHADKTGTARYNFTLSLRRAQAVLEALVERGIPKFVIRAFGFGDTDPRVPEEQGVPEPQNRRVEIYIGGK